MSSSLSGILNPRTKMPRPANVSGTSRSPSLCGWQLVLQRYPRIAARWVCPNRLLALEEAVLQHGGYQRSSGASSWRTKTASLKRLVADLTLDRSVRQYAFRRKVTRPSVRSHVRCGPSSVSASVGSTWPLVSAVCPSAKESSRIRRPRWRCVSRSWLPRGFAVAIHGGPDERWVGWHRVAASEPQLVSLSEVYNRRVYEDGVPLMESADRGVETARQVRTRPSSPRTVKPSERAAMVKARSSA